MVLAAGLQVVRDGIASPQKTPVAADAIFGERRAGRSAQLREAAAVC